MKNGNLDMLRFAKEDRFDLQAYITLLFQGKGDGWPRDGLIEIEQVELKNTNTGMVSSIDEKLKEHKRESVKELVHL